MGMGSEAREQAADLERLLLTEPQRFTMMQALWLPGALNAGTAEETDRFSRQSVRVVPWLSLAFPPAESLPAETAAPSAGDTARVERPPKLLTDLAHIPKFYPPRARRNGWEGTVVLDVRVAPDGTCAEASILTSSGHDVLDKAALRMIRSARFSHGPGRVRQPISFSLTQ